MMVFGIIAIFLAILAIIRIYHAFMAEIYREEMQEELDKRFRNEIEFRWSNQDVVIRQQLVIVDETNR